MGAIRSGGLVDGDALPSSRALANAYDIPRSSVVDAYETLCGIGMLTSAHGSGTRVCPGAFELLRRGEPAQAPNPRRQPRPANGAVIDLRVPGLGDESILDQRDWNRAWRAAVDPTCEESGTKALSRALVDHLRSFRGVALDGPGQLVLRPSMGSAIDEIVHGLGLAGRGVALEDPGYPRLPGYLAKAGCRVHCVPVDDQGLRVDLLSPDAAAVHVTPARQWPTGATLSPERREQLLDWARRTGGIIIENDYDAEFTYGHAPPPTLKTMATEDVAVVYVGSSAKLITKDLHVVWLAVPASFRRRARDTAPVSDYPARTLATYMETGALYRHHNRALHLYDERRAALVHHLGLRVPQVSVEGDRAGTELVVGLPDGCDEVGVQLRIEDAGFRVSTLGDFAVRHHRPALLLQYGELPAATASQFAGALEDVLASRTAAGA